MLDTRKRQQDLSSLRHRQHACEEKRRNRRMQTVYKKDHVSNGTSHRGIVNVECTVNVSSHSGRHVSVLDKRDGKDGRSNSRLQVITDTIKDRKCYQKDSFGSKHQRHSSTDVTDSQFWDGINGKPLSSHGERSAHRRSSSAGSRSKPFGSNAKNVDSAQYRDSLSNSALKHKMEKKLRWINSMQHDARQHHTGEDTRSLIKMPVNREPLISGISKHKKKLLTTTKHDGALDLFYEVLLKSNL